LVAALKAKEAGMSQSIRVLENGKRKLAVAKREFEKSVEEAEVVDDISTDEQRSVLFEQELLSFKSDCITNSKQVLEKGNLLKARLAAAKSSKNVEKSIEKSEEIEPEIKLENRRASIENKHIHFNESVKVKTFKKPENVPDQAISDLQKAVNDIKENIEKMEDMLKDMEKNWHG